MICDLPKHGKMQPNHPDPVGPPLDYMAECQVFDDIWSGLYDLCHFYILGMTGNPPEFPTLQELVTCSQVRDLLKSDCHVPAAGTAHGHLFEVPTGGPLGQICKDVILPLLHICGVNDLSYLNHIIIVHYNISYGCGKCLKQAFMSSSALHNHKKVCLGFAKKPTAGSDSKPSSGSGGDSSQGGSSTRATPKKKDSKAPAADSQGSSTPMALQMTPHHSRRDKSHCSKHHKDSKSKKDSLGDKKKKKHVSPTRKGSGHKSTQSQQPMLACVPNHTAISPACSCFICFSHPCFFSNKLFLL